MKTWTLYIALIFAFATGIAQPTDSIYVARTKDEKELVRLTKLMSFASETGDSATYRKYLEDEFLITYSSCKPNSYGRFATKSQVIAKWTGSRPINTSAGTSTPTIYRIQVSGNTGVVHSFIADQSVDDTGKRQDAYSWVTDIWVKRRNQWHWLSSHESLLNN